MTRNARYGHFRPTLENTCLAEEERWEMNMENQKVMPVLLNQKARKTAEKEQGFNFVLEHSPVQNKWS